MLTENIDPIIYNGVSTIGQKYLIPKMIGTVNWSWTYDEHQLHTKRLNNLLSFTSPPVNILSETALAEPMNYDEGTWVVTKLKYYILTFYFGKYKNTIVHPENFFQN